MLRYGKAALLAAAIIGTQAFGATDPSMGADDPARFYASLRDMGYAPEAMDMKSDLPSTVITSSGSKYWAALGGCTKNSNCSYVVIGSSFIDVADPSPVWVAEQNRDLDLLKVWVNDEKKLSYAASTLTGGLTRAQFRAVMDALANSEAELGRRATEAKLVK